MTLNKISILTAICILTSIDNVFATGGLTGTGTTQMTLTNPIYISCGDLSFGTLSYTGAGGRYKVPASGTASVSNATNGSIKATTAGGPATCTIYGPAGLSAPTVSTPTAGTALGTGLTVSNYSTTSPAAIGSSGTSTTFKVGGELNVTNSASAGTYTGGTYNVTISY